MRVFCLVLAVLFFFSSCYSTPRVSRAILIEEGRYDVKIKRDYTHDQQEFRYAINSFVMDLGETSYNVQIEQRSRINYYFVTVPGSQPVEDLPPVRHFHKGKTIAAIVAPIGGVVELGLTLMPLWMVLIAVNASSR